MLVYRAEPPQLSISIKDLLGGLDQVDQIMSSKSDHMDGCHIGANKLIDHNYQYRQRLCISRHFSVHA